VVKIGINEFIRIKIVLVCLFVLFQNNALAQQAIFIQPGEGVGVLKLDDSLESINGIMGKIRADNLQKVRSAGGIEMWLLYQDMGLTLIYDYSTKKLKRIIVTSGAMYVEDTNIHVGSDTSDVIAYYDTTHRTTTTDSERKKIIWNYPEMGIGFWIGEQEQTIYAIEVMRRE